MVAKKTVNERVFFGGSLHTNFLQQIEELMANSNVGEEDREKILANMSCPCCGGGAASFILELGKKD